MKSSPQRDAFFQHLLPALTNRTLVKLTLGKPLPAAEPDLVKVFARPVELKSGPQFSFVFRYRTRDITKNYPEAETLALIDTLLGHAFGDAHLQTPVQSIQFQTLPGGKHKLSVKTAHEAPAAPASGHDRSKGHTFETGLPWLKALGVINERGQPREGMSAKFRQIQKFGEVLKHLLHESGLTGTDQSEPVRVHDMGCGKGYLTFAIAELLGPRGRVTGVERRSGLVTLCNRIAGEQNLASRLRFVEGQIEPNATEQMDVLIALHACDTATDDALAAGIHAGARLLVLSPCCHKELRPQLKAPSVLEDALRHGIFQEREAEFVTDAIRAQLLEWCGYRTRVFEFISPEHTSKNLMIAAIKTGPDRQESVAKRLGELARFYGIKEQRLARHLGFALD